MEALQVAIVPKTAPAPGANSGYYKNEKATKSVIDSEGWLHTGDMGVRTADGTLFIKGRSKTMILSATGQETHSRVWYAANLDTGAVQAIHCADADRISIAAHNETSLLLCRTAPDGTLSYSVISLRDFLDGKAPTPCTLCRSEFAGTLAAP